MENFPAFVVEKQGEDVQRGWREITASQLPPGDVLVQVDYSALNYKDALAASAHPGVARRLPLVPGIDAVGTVLEGTAEWPAGTTVQVANAKFGTEVWGGYSRLIRVPNEWLLPIPAPLTPLQAITLGTAGVTAAQCVLSLQHHDVEPSAGDVVVSGATGGVGCFAVRMLARLGYSVAAVTGKPEQTAWLQQLGAREILGRDAVDDRTQRPLLPGRWAGAVDTVGGHTLATIIRQTAPGGCVTACGVVGGAELPLTVYPFILRGVQLSGIDSAGLTRERRLAIWQRIASDLHPGELREIAIVIEPGQLELSIQQILAGRIRGRIVVDLACRSQGH